MTVFLVCLLCFFAVLARKLYATNKQLKNDLQKAQVAFVEEQERCHSYERALGLSFWDRKEVENQLWAKFMQGDEVALDIMASRMAEYDNVLD